MNEYSLLSPEKVHLKLNMAGVGSRFVALFIDMVVQVLLATFLVAVVHFTDYSEYDNGWGSFTGMLFLAIIFLISFAVFYGYFIFFETIWNGQTPGKRFAHLRVVLENGASVTFSAVLIRNILRIIDALPFVYGIGITSIFITEKNQRLGDMAAGTMVIREISEDAPLLLDYKVSETPWSGVAGLHIHNITEADFTVLKKYLLCRKTIKSKAVSAMDEKLTRFFCQKLGLNVEEIENPGEFLAQVAAFYLHR